MRDLPSDDALGAYEVLPISAVVEATDELPS